MPATTTADAPSPKRIPVRVELHGDVLTDDYAWMRDLAGDPDVRPHIDAENAYAEMLLAGASGLRSELYDELVAHVTPAETSVHMRRGDWVIYSRTEAGKQYRIHCRRPVLDGPAHEVGDSITLGDEQILLDENELAEGNDFLSIGAMAVSPDDALLAYVVDTSGNERHTVRVRDIASGDHLDIAIADASTSLEWFADSRTIVYGVVDDTNRPFELRQHDIRSGAPDGSDSTVVLHDDDERYFLYAYHSRDRSTIMLAAQSKITSDVRIVPASDPSASPRETLGRTQGVEYEVDVHGDQLIVRTNHKAPEFRIAATPLAAPSLDNLTDIVAARDGVTVEDFRVHRGHLGVYERSNGRIDVRVVPVNDAGTFAFDASRVTSFDEPAFMVYPAQSGEFDSPFLRFSYTSMATPTTVIDLDAGSEQQHRRWQQSLDWYDASKYETDRIWATASDGVKVPITLLYRRDLDRSRPHPLHMYGYGSYGFSVDPTFVQSRISLVDRGWIYAIAHVRGGGDLGEHWRDGGKLMTKRNTFTDFIACAEHLVSKGHTTPEQLSAQGGSAGGMLMGAITNMRPDLFAVVIADVPFVDVMNTMLDPTLPLTVLEYEEWGNPNNADAFAYMRSYSPYDNVTDQDYPAVLATAGLNDPRVSYWEPAKWVARLRDHNTGTRPIALHTNTDAGHGGSSGRYAALREVAMRFAWIITNVSSS